MTLLVPLVLFAQESPSWTVRAELVLSSVSNAGDEPFRKALDSTNSGNSIEWGMLYGAGAVLATPEWSGLAATLGMHVAYLHEYTRVDDPDHGNSHIDLTGTVLDLAPGVQWRPFRRHLFGFQCRFAYIPLGDQEVKLDGSAASSGSHLAVHPHLAVSYAYRILDRVELGLEVDLTEPGLYDGHAIRAGGFSYTPGSDGGGRELRLHAGWPIGL
jgi:hypothetical protein